MACARYECKEEGGSSSTAGGSDDLITNAVTNIIKGGMTGNIDQFNLGGGLLGLGMMMEGLKGNPQEDAHKAQEAAERQRQIQLQIELQRQEDLRQQEQAKQRVLGLLKGTESSGDLGLKMDSDQPLTVTTERGAFGSTAVVPVSPSAPSVGGLQLKLGDDAEQSSAQARQGFDTIGKMKGADLPAPPPAPALTPIARLKKMNALLTTLNNSKDEEKALKALLEKLRQSSNPDETAIKDAQQKIEANEDDQKQVKKQLLDLTAEDDNAGAGQLQDNPSAISGK